jgi:carboxypeptidase Taq
VPSSFIERLTSHMTAAYHTWEQARPANDFAAVRPMLEKTVEMSRELAAYHPGYEHPYDPLIDLAEDGMTVAAVRALFDELRAGLVPLIKAIRERPEVDGGCLSGNFPEAAQQAFGEQVIRAFGYDYTRGRQDKTAHPFMTKLGRGDVRITTRYSDDFLPDGLFSTLHEAGHAMYEQGIADDLEGTPLFSGTTAGVHESQSRLWENLVGRSLPFWSHWYGSLQAAFPGELDDVSIDTSIARSTRSFRRSSGRRPTKSPTTCTSCCASTSSSRCSRGRSRSPICPRPGGRASRATSV